MLNFCIRDSHCEMLLYINCQKLPDYKCKCFHNGELETECSYETLVTIQFNLLELQPNHTKWCCGKFKIINQTVKNVCHF